MSAERRYLIISLQERLIPPNKSIIDFEIRKRFMDAIAEGRYLITISTHDKKHNRLNHYAVFNNYPTDDIIPSLEQVNRLVFKQMPNHDPKKDNPAPDAKSG